MMEKLSLVQEQPQKRVAPDIKFLNKLTELGEKKKKIEKQLSTAGDEEKRFLEIDLEQVNKQIERYHQSFGRYRRAVKINDLKEAAGEENVAEALNFKGETRQPASETTGVAKSFLDDLEEFKKKKKVA